VSANQDLFDAQLRHEITVRQYAAREVRKALAVLDKANLELEAKLATSLIEGESVTSKRFKALLKDMQIVRNALIKKMALGQVDRLVELGRTEQAAMKKILETEVPVRLDYATVNASQIRAAITTMPFAGGANNAANLGNWWKKLQAADATRISEALQLGMTQGETVPQMTNRVKGVAGLSRANAEAVIRTGINHAINSSREEFFKANSEVIHALRWTSTLDGRTSAICRARDGHYTPLTPGQPVPPPLLQPPGARPPAHPSCRSLMVSVLTPDGIAQKMPPRPFVRDSRTRRFREKDFRAESKAAVGDKRWKKMTVKQRNDAIRKRRTTWTREAVGQVPAKTNYDQWLRKQPAKFQDEVLGKGKAKLFRKGLKLDRFVDRKGQELTLKQLQRKSGVKFAESKVGGAPKKAMSEAQKASLKKAHQAVRDKAAAKKAAAPQSFVEKQKAKMRAEREALAAKRGGKIDPKRPKKFAKEVDTEEAQALREAQSRQTGAAKKKVVSSTAAKKKATTKRQTGEPKPSQVTATRKKATTDLEQQMEDAAEGRDGFKPDKTDFKPAKDLKEAQARMKEEGLTFTFGDRGMPNPGPLANEAATLQMTNFYQRASEDLLKRFPKLRGRMPEMLLKRFPKGNTVGRATMPSTLKPGQKPLIHVRPNWDANTDDWITLLGIRNRLGRLPNVGGGSRANFGYASFRHEVGHTLSTPKILGKWRSATVGKDKSWFMKRVSDYSATNAEEQLAECFAMFTEVGYKAGTLPKEMESVIQLMLSGG
jgi:SPP1 gp7 family putative phage head morphogenesis protein